MLSYRISYSDDLQIYPYRKHILDIGFKASKIHMKTGRFFFGSVYIGEIPNKRFIGAYNHSVTSAMFWRKRTKWKQRNIRILYGYGVRIENFVPRVTVWHHEALQDSDPEGRNFLSAPNTHVWFFFLHTFPFRFVFFKEAFIATDNDVGIWHF